MTQYKQNVSKKIKIGIIGAGVAGMTAADYLTKNHPECEVTILEAEDRIGGRVHSEVKNDCNIEFGAGWLYSHELLQRAQDKNFQPKPYEVMDIVSEGHENNKFYANGSLIDIKRIQYFWSLLHRFSKLLSKLSVDISFASLFKFLKLCVWGRADKEALDIIGRLLASISQTTLDKSRVTPLVFTTGKKQGYIIQDRVIELFDYDTNKVQTILGCRVRKVDYSKNLVKVHTDQDSFDFDKVLITVSVGVLQSKVISFVPSLPDYKIAAIDSVDMGRGEKIFYFYDEVFFDKSAHAIGLVNYLDANEVDPLNSTFLFNLLCVYNKPVLMEFVYGEEYEKIQSFSEDELRERNLKMLKTVYGSNALPAAEIMKSNWTQNPNFCGTWSNDNVNSMDRELIRKNVDEKLYFAGEATWREYPYMDHAIASALKSCKEMFEGGS